MAWLRVTGPSPSDVHRALAESEYVVTHGPFAYVLDVPRRALLARWPTATIERKSPPWGRDGLLREGQ